MKNGPYTLVKAPDDYPGMRYRGRYVYQHHLVWWMKTGEVVGPGFTIHHKNEKKRDNRFSNLEKLTRGEHTKCHSEPAAQVTLRCCFCDASFDIPERNHRSKSKAGQTRFYCSRSCQVKAQWRDGAGRVGRVEKIRAAALGQSR